MTKYREYRTADHKPGWNGYFGGDAEDAWHADPANMVKADVARRRSHYAHASIWRRFWLRRRGEDGWHEDPRP